jgi:phosphotransferase system HPr (HPr) family protein
MLAARVVLPEALHARPANLLVRRASGFEARVTVLAKTCTADAKNILEVLALGAARGDSIELRADGADAEPAIAALRELIERAFDGDLVPERGEGGAAGIAVGRALVTEPVEEGDAVSRPPAEERARLDSVARRVEADLATLIASLSAAEAPLFEPAIPILRQLVAGVAAAIEEGEATETAVRRLTEEAKADLILDARARLLAALAGSGVFGRVGAEADDEEHVLVTGDLVPSLVALAPRSVSGIVASRPEGQTGRAAVSTSHAAILARGRGMPLAFVPRHVTDGVSAGEWIVIDATDHEARVWVGPSEALMTDARSRRLAHAEEHRARSEAAVGSLDHLGVAVRVNIGATTEEIPASAEGVGLVRTELLYPAWPHAPGEADLALALSAIARGARGGPVVARLYDAGGDKPLAWLPSPADDPEARGIALLLRHPVVLAAQIAAMARVRASHDLRLLIPLTRSEHDVIAVRALSASDLPVGAMIETPEAAHCADAIARSADFVCIGTNDLTASLGPGEPPLGARVLSLVRGIVRAARAHGRTVTVCGELASDPRGARVLVGLGVHALSVSPPKLAVVRALLLATTREACEREAESLLGRE